MRTHGCWRQTLQVKPAQPAEGPRQGPAVGPQAGFLAKAMLCHKAWVGDALEGIEVQGKGDHAEHKGSKPSVPQMNRRRRCRGSSPPGGGDRPRCAPRPRRIADPRRATWPESGHRCRDGEPARSARRGQSGCSPRPRVRQWRGCRSGGPNHSWRSPTATGSASRRDACRCRGLRTASGWPARSTACHRCPGPTWSPPTCPSRTLTRIASMKIAA